MTTAITVAEAAAAIEAAAVRSDLLGVAVLSYCGLSVGDIVATPPEAISYTPPDVATPDLTPRKPLTPEEARAILASAERAGPRDAAMVELALTCGLRQVELRRLRERDIGRAEIRVKGKGGKWREVPIPRRLAERLAALTGGRYSDEAVFRAEKTDNSLSENGIRTILNQHIKPVRDTAVAHDLRHTCLTWMLRLGAGLEEAMEVAGHDEVSSHEVYAVASDSWVEKEWARTHPLGAGSIAYVDVPGEPFVRRMAKGIRRTALVPALYAVVIMEALGKFENERQIVNLFYKKGLPAPSHLRTAGAVHMTANGAHPFLVGLMLGIQPATVVARRLDRMGEAAGAERRRAVEGVSEVLTGGGA